MSAGDLDAIQKLFLLTPLREGRPTTVIFLPVAAVFLLTPLREGRRQRLGRSLMNL